MKTLLPLRFTAALSSAVILSGLSFGQSFNIDGGAIGAAPAATYGAGAGQPGVWNEVPAASVNMPLVDLTGAATSVTCSESSAFDFFTDNAGTTGDDQALMDDIWDGIGTTTISGLMHGNYTVYTYAWAPDSTIPVTAVDVVNSPDPQGVCPGGTWPGSHMVDMTYVVHTVVVDAASPDIIIDRSQITSFVSGNGVQIVMEGSTSIGTPFCDPNGINCNGVSATLTANLGSGVGSDLHLSVTNGANNEFGYFLASAGMDPTGITLSRGQFCLVDGVNPFARFNFGSSGFNSLGQFSGDGMVFNNLVMTGTSAGGTGYDVPATIPIAGNPNTSGSTWNFQLWYRDSLCDVAGSSNFSNGLSVMVP